MIPDRPGPGDLLPSPEGAHLIGRGEVPGPLVLHALEEIETVKGALRDLKMQLEALAARVSAIESRQA